MLLLVLLTCICESAQLNVCILNTSLFDAGSVMQYIQNTKGRPDLDEESQQDQFHNF